MFEMRLTDVRREVDEMLERFEHQATFSLKKIDRRFESLGQSLDEEFKQYFLQISIERLSTSYTKVQIESNRNQTETGGFTNEPSTQPGYGLIDDNQSTGTLLGSLVKEERTNSIDDIVNVKWEEVETQLNSMAEELSSNDMENIDESQNYQLRMVKVECEETDWMNDACGNEMSQNNDERNIDEVTIKEEFYIEPKLEVIDEDPNDVSLNGGYSTSNKVTNGNRAGSSFELKEDKEKPSCSKNTKQFNCELCAYGSDRKAHFKRHMQIHTNEKPFQCSRCPKRFTQSCHLKAHMVLHKDEFPFHCSNCFRGFFQDDEKFAHEKKCKHRRYQCYVCKYFTDRKTNLVIHMRTHSGNKPYQCSHCSKGFITLQHLKMHMPTHKDTNLPFHCKGCLRRFPEESEKKAHEKSCQYRRYECDICRKFVTALKSKMENHIRTHTGEKPFRCEVCMKCFNQKSSLTRHLNTVHKTVS